MTIYGTILWSTGSRASADSYYKRHTVSQIDNSFLSDAKKEEYLTQFSCDYSSFLLYCSVMHIPRQSLSQFSTEHRHKYTYCKYRNASVQIICQKLYCKDTSGQSKRCFLKEAGPESKILMRSHLQTILH